MTPLAPTSSPWATLRFRRSKDVKGWAILGIPQSLYPLVMQPLFERQARFIDKYERGEFVNVLFEAPASLAAQLALAFPAPPGCDPLVVNGGGDRVLYGKAADSARARRQRPEGEPRPELGCLAQGEGFWDVVTALAESGSAGPRPERRADPGLAALEGDGSAPKEPIGPVGSARSVATASGAIAHPRASVVSLPPGLDEEGFELDAWPEEDPGVAAAGDGSEPGAAWAEAEAFEDVWETEEADEFWPLEPCPDAGARAHPAPGESVQPPVGERVHPSLNEQSAIELSPAQGPGLDGPAPWPTAPEPAALVPKTPVGVVVAAPPPAQLRSGLVPHGSDAQVLQGYASGGLTIAQAIAQMQQREAQPPQRRRIELPFEQTSVPIAPAPVPRLSPGPPAQLPSESWARAARGLASSDRAGAGESPWAVPSPDGRRAGTGPGAEAWPRTPHELPSVDLSQQLSPAPTDIVCLPVTEVHHGGILCRGVALWNAWRRDNPEIRPNLRSAYLNNLDLHGADLQGVDLRNAFLFRADLRGADLSLASLHGADLIRADLGGACLWGACLAGAYLNYANLAQADLTQANVRGAFWQGAILQGAIMPNGQDFAAWAAG